MIDDYLINILIMISGFGSGLFVGMASGTAGAIMIPCLTIFVGWYVYNYYAGVRSWGWVGAGEFPFGVLFLVPAIFLFYCSGISFMALKNANKPPSKNSIQLGFKLSFVVFILALIGGILFVLTVGDVNEWWFGEAFYGGLLGGGLTSLFLHLSLKNIN